jgi:cell fate regulator YaaT (PSP1 superfamily)
VAAVVTVQRLARGRGLAMKVVDVEMHPSARRVLVHFNAEDRVDFRELVRDLAREFRARIEMRQIGARDTTRVLDGIGPCGRQLCCSSHLKKFEPISVKMAKAQDMPLTDSRLLGNCGRLKCCLLYEFSTYEELRSRLPRVNSPCSASCGGSGCMTGKVRSLRVLKQTVVVGFPDGTEAEVPLDQLTWEGRRPT